MPSPRVANVSDVFVSDECEPPPPQMVLKLPPLIILPLPSTGGLEYKKAWEIEDEKSGLSDNQRIMREFRAITNTILPFIQVKSDY